MEYDENDKFVQAAWCSFGADVLRDGGGDASFTYNAFTGRLRYLPSVSTTLRYGAGDEGRDLIVDADEDRGRVLEALARNLGRILRWGGGSTCTVLAHSVRVAHLAAAVARHLPTHPDDTTVAACRRLGALHDLHEGLPGIGDVPSPTLRLLRRTVPTIDRIHTQAENLVLYLAGARSLLAGLAPAAVKFADRLAATVERGAYFADAPAWMGPDLQRVGVKMLRSTLPRTCVKWDEASSRDPGLLLRLISGEYQPVTEGPHRSAWIGWCDDVLACLGAIDRPWQSVLADMVPGT